MNPHDPRHARATQRVDPHLVFGISLFAALVLSWSSLSGAMHGRVDIVQAGIHLLVALAISWAGCYAVGSLVYGYAQSAAMPAPQQPEASDPALQRRATDVIAPTFEAGALTPGLEVVEAPESDTTPAR